ncbi:hypothetical protein [Roseofilum capinflatum]|uniref:SWIM-type domain-containing protein n=1 Tax=Roseofilum capinflatum BLCC-M114 TaxID=3022440 RepID=A0ABT7BAR5_9CYAN|nr:hypothetical protein [Roseofilum capinflatum]MDJ1176236.1 hypothetical protein [Roseofilum capinflatum BLCC-M114]
MKPYPLVTYHINPRSNSQNTARSESGLEVGSPQFATWAQHQKKFKFQVYWQPSHYSVVYDITCHLRSNQSWYACKCIGGIFKQHPLGTTAELTPAKLMEAVQWLCPEPQVIPADLSPDSETEPPPLTQNWQQQLRQTRYDQLLLEIEDLQHQLDRLSQDNQHLKLDRQHLWQQQTQSLKTNQELQATIDQLMAEQEYYQTQLKNLNRVVNELGSKIESVNLKTNPRWYYANRYYQQLREILNLDPDETIDK